MKESLSANAVPFTPSFEKRAIVSSTLSADVPEFIPSFSVTSGVCSDKDNTAVTKHNVSRSKFCFNRTSSVTETANNKKEINNKTFQKRNRKQKDLIAVKSVPLRDKKLPNSVDEKIKLNETDSKLFAVARGRFACRNDRTWYKQKNLLAVQYSLPPTVYTEPENIDDGLKLVPEEKAAVSENIHVAKEKKKHIVMLSKSVGTLPKSVDSSKVKNQVHLSPNPCKSNEAERILNTLSGDTKKPLSWSAIVKKPPPVINNNSLHNIVESSNKTEVSPSSSIKKRNNTETKPTVAKRKSIPSNLSNSSHLPLEKLIQNIANDTSISNQLSSVTFEKRKLIRTKKTFSNSSSSSDEASKRQAEIERLKSGTEAVKICLQTYIQAIEKSKEVYKITKIKHKIQNKTERQQLKSETLKLTQQKPGLSLLRVQKEPEKKRDVDSARISCVVKRETDVVPKLNDVENSGCKDLNEFPVLEGTQVYMNKSFMSYSTILKKTAFEPPTHKTSVASDASIANKTFSDENEIRLLKKQRKALKRKMKIKMRKEESRQGVGYDTIFQQTKSKSPTKQSEKEMTLDLSDMFEKLFTKPSKNIKSGQKSKQKKVTISTGVISVVSGLSKKNTLDGRKVQKNKYGGTHTMLDGSMPIKKRGKERETPKKKRPTLLKKIIKAERERKRKLQEKCENDQTKEIRPDEKPLVVSPEVISAVTKTPADLEVIKDEKDKIQLNELPEHLLKKLHSRKFREYCNHVLTKEINDLTYNLLTTLQRFQDRVYHENPIKYKQKRRFVLGLREVLKHMKVKKIKAVIMAPNLERISVEGGLDDYLAHVQSLCKEHEIPQIFALNRHVLGRPLKKKAPVSIVGIFNYDGAQDAFKELMEHVRQAQVTYNAQVTALLESEYGQIPDISIHVDHALEEIHLVNDTISINQTLASNTETTELMSVEAEKIKQTMLEKLARHEFVFQDYDDQ